jgi:hypothetical protein
MEDNIVVVLSSWSQSYLLFSGISTYLMHFNEKNKDETQIFKELSPTYVPTVNKVAR